MKSRIRYYFSLGWFGAGMILLFVASCNKEQTEEPQPGWVKVQPSVPGYYMSVPTSVQTRQVDDKTLQNVPIQLLEDGSTVRLLVYKKNEGTTPPEYTLQTEFSKTYAVRTVGGTTLLYPCTVNEAGEPDTSSSGEAPLYLPIGVYAFRALSPAKGLGADGTLTIGNGEYLLSTDERYAQTSMQDHSIQKEATVQTVLLSPIINQTARLQFIIKEGTGVHSLELLPEGIEISGIQNPGGGLKFDLSAGDTLVMKKGDSQSSVRITKSVQQEDGAFLVETGVLPTDARSHSICVLLNLKVNGNPTQFQMLLNDMLLLAGHSYNYKATVTINAGVTVLTWQNRTWTEEVEIN